ncbi:MAG: M20/M25/M40 family metallo-hydrolase [Acidobacteriota bacterium]
MPSLKRVSLVAALLILGFTLLLLSSEPLFLIKIHKVDAAHTALLERLEIQVLQELRTFFLARADREDLRLLRTNHVPLTVLDPPAAGRQYFLAPSASAGRLAALGPVLQLIEVEPGTLLGSSDILDPAEVIPPDLAWAPLPSSSSFLRLRYPTLPLETPAHAPADAADGLIQLLVNQVSRENIASFVRSLELFETRYASTAQCEAAGDFIFLYFQSLGLNPSFEPFTFRTSISTRNVIAELRGRTEPDEVVIVCAHYDSTSDTPTVLAPGADDNASGTAAVMEAARVLAPQAFDFTVRFIAFSGEEGGLNGSRHHSTLSWARGDRIIGVINMDMIAYADAMPEDLEVFVNQRSAWLAEWLGLSASTYTGLPVNKRVDPSVIYSDHSPFWDRGYAATLLIEDLPLQNPFYHKPTDTSDTLNFEFCGDSAKTAVAVLSGLAQPIKPGYPPAPTGLEEETSLYSSLFSALTVVHLTWRPVPGALGYNVYRSATSHLDYEKINSSPLGTTAFVDQIPGAGSLHYYVVTSLGGGDLESNYSREVESIAGIPLSSRTVFLLFPALRLRGGR